MQPGFDINVGIKQGRADGHAATHRLGHAHDVRLQVEMITGKESSGSTEASLDFIDNQQYSTLGTELAHYREIVGLDRIDAAFTLHQLEHDGRGIAVHRGIELFDLIEGYVVEAGNQRLKCFAILWCVSGTDRTHGATVEATHRGDKVSPPGVQARKLECGLDRLGARVA